MKKSTAIELLFLSVVFSTTVFLTLLDARADGVKYYICNRCSSESHTIATAGQPCEFTFYGISFQGTISSDIRGKKCVPAFVLAICAGRQIMASCVTKGGSSASVGIGYSCGNENDENSN